MEEWCLTCFVIVFLTLHSGFTFSVAYTRLYKSLCWSLCLLVGRAVHNHACRDWEGWMRSEWGVNYKNELGSGQNLLICTDIPFCDLVILVVWTVISNSPWQLVFPKTSIQILKMIFKEKFIWNQFYTQDHLEKFLTNRFCY